MTVNPEALRLAARQRAEANAVMNGTVRSLSSAWVQAWDELAGPWHRALEDLATMNDDGTWPTRSQLLRAERTMKALDVTRRALDGLEDVVRDEVVSALPDLTAEAVRWESRIMASQMPDVAGPTAQVAAGFSRVDPAALESIVTRTTGQIESLVRPLSVQATQAMTGTLIRGVALGQNPRRSASQMLQRVEGNFNGGLARALNISRTEQIDAYRAASQVQNAANAELLAGWEWLATLDTRTCESCLAQHGSRHAVAERGPDDHQQGRCARLPVTKTWKELGFNITEPPSAMPDAQGWFRGLSDTDQAKIMGAEKLALFKSGRVGWGDLSVKRPNPNWRDSWAPASLKQLRAVTTPTAAVPSMDLRPVSKPVAKPKPVTKKASSDAAAVAAAKTHANGIVHMPGEESAANLARQELARQAVFTPKSMLELRGVRLAEVGESGTGSVTELAYYDRGGRTLKMVARPGPDLQDQHDYATETGWFSKCGHDHDAFESLIAHEYGHHVHEIIEDMTWDAKTKFWAGAADDLDLPAPDRYAQRRWVDENRAALTDRVSAYGATDPDELLAEVWAEYTTNPNARPHIKALGSRIQQAAERSAGRKKKS